MAEVTELKPSKPANEGDTPAKTETDQATPAPQTPRGPRGRPPNGSRRPPEARQPAFFDKVASVPKEDWGAGADIRAGKQCDVVVVLHVVALAHE